MEPRVQCDPAEPLGIKAPMLHYGTSWSQGSGVPLRGLTGAKDMVDGTEAHGNDGILGHCRASWNQGDHCDTEEELWKQAATVEPRRALLTVQNLLELRGHCSTARPRGTKGPW